MFSRRNMVGVICLLSVNTVVAFGAARQHRRTVDGRLCAASFVQAGTAYTGCTDSIDPNGISGRAWCYVEAQLASEQNPAWGFCAPAIDYNEARREAQKRIAAKTQLAQKYISRLHKAEAAAEDTLKMYRAHCA